MNGEGSGVCDFAPSTSTSWLRHCRAPFPDPSPALSRALTSIRASSDSVPQLLKRGCAPAVCPTKLYRFSRPLKPLKYVHCCERISMVWFENGFTKLKFGTELHMEVHNGCVFLPGSVAVARTKIFKMVSGSHFE